MTNPTPANVAAAKAARLTTKADTAAADRLLKRGLSKTVAMIRAGQPREDYVTVLTTATAAADLLLEV